MFCLTIDGKWEADLSAPVEIGIPLRFGDGQPNAFGLPRASASPVVTTAGGGPVNCITVTLNPHGNGTHTECAAHICDDPAPVYSAAPPGLIPACLVSVAPENGALRRAALARALKSVPTVFRNAVILRTGEQEEDTDYTGTNPPYLTVDAMAFLRSLEVEHLLIDLPSVDPEDDEGAVRAHKIFWDVPGPPRVGTITEMIRVPRQVKDGLYVLALNTPRFVLDAAPSRPVIWPVFPRG